ncbi:unnamed protein product [Dovyalis caffra]|uniref:Uncharacterized protein n=1 Tax=Dovyalis caffra TaxID=77055 RepID=A0AAV1SEG0_9ROSI|nr:unnamed protein product [Dovyalis caffra]
MVNDIKTIREENGDDGGTCKATRFSEFRLVYKVGGWRGLVVMLDDGDSSDDVFRARRRLWLFLDISSDVEEAERASLLVSADVIYSDDLTDALF